MTGTPKRSLGVTLSAVASILGSALLLLLTFFMVVGATLGTMQRSAPPYLGTMLWIEGLVLAGFAAWGIVTAVGLFRLRGWARWSIILFAVWLLGIGVMAGVAMAIVPLPSAPGAPAGLMDIVRIGMVCFYAFLALIGGLWLYFFHTAGVREQFGAGVGGPGGRPMSIWLIGVLLIFGGIMCLGGLFFPLPTGILGLTLRGWGARVFYLVFAVAECWLGYDLLRLRPLSRLLAIAFFAFAIVNGLVFALLPDYPRRMLEAMPAGWPGADQPGVLTGVRPVMLLSLLVMLVPIWFLVVRRDAFTPRPGSEQIPGQQAL